MGGGLRQGPGGGPGITPLRTTGVVLNSKPWTLNLEPYTLNPGP